MHATLRFSARMRPFLLVDWWRMPPAGQQCQGCLGPPPHLWTSNLYLHREGHEVDPAEHGWPRPLCGAKSRAMRATLRFSARMCPLLLVEWWRMPPAGQQCHDRLGPPPHLWTSNLFWGLLDFDSLAWWGRAIHDVNSGPLDVWKFEPWTFEHVWIRIRSGLNAIEEKWVSLTFGERSEGKHSLICPNRFSEKDMCLSVARYGWAPDIEAAAAFLSKLGIELKTHFYWCLGNWEAMTVLLVLSGEVEKVRSQYWSMPQLQLVWSNDRIFLSVNVGKDKKELMLRPICTLWVPIILHDNSQFKGDWHGALQLVYSMSCLLGSVFKAAL